MEDNIVSITISSITENEELFFERGVDEIVVDRFQDNYGHPKLVYLREHIYIGISATSISSVTVSYPESYSSYTECVGIEKVTKQENMYALHLILNDYSYVSKTGMSNTRTSTFDVTVKSKSKYYKTSSFNITQHGCEAPCIVFMAMDDNCEIGFKNRSPGHFVFYSIDANSWTSASTTDTIQLTSSGDCVYVRGIYSYYNRRTHTQFKTNKGRVIVFGNITSMANYINLNEPLEPGYFKNLFKGCTWLADASELELPTMTLAEECYHSMFMNCTNLTNAPELPAETLSDRCYYLMFNGCTSLVKAQELPAKSTAGSSCYEGMFRGCTSLTKAPDLPATTLGDYAYTQMFEWCEKLEEAPELLATTLASSCYSGMFNGCTRLTKAPELPATTLYPRCYEGMFSGCTALEDAPKMSATTLATMCCQSMFAGCTSLTGAPQLDATELAKDCYENMFNGCTSLEKVQNKLPAMELPSNCYEGMFANCTSLKRAPELPASHVGYQSYNYMFSGCAKLSYIKCLAVVGESDTFYSLNNWVRDVSSSGDFYRAISATKWTTGPSGIPRNWTIYDVEQE